MRTQSTYIVVNINICTLEVFTIQQFLVSQFFFFLKYIKFVKRHRCKNIIISVKNMQFGALLVKRLVGALLVARLTIGRGWTDGYLLNIFSSSCLNLVPVKFNTISTDDPIHLTKSPPPPPSFFPNTVFLK